MKELKEKAGTGMEQRHRYIALSVRQQPLQPAYFTGKYITKRKFPQNKRPAGKGRSPVYCILQNEFDFTLVKCRMT